MKAFDPLDHNILLNKIKYLGFTPKTIDWFGSYLKRQNVVVILKKRLSEIGILNCGVPQGSILGLILFLSNGNDMKKSLKIVTSEFLHTIRVYFVATKMSNSSKEISFMI